jgi:hypothetical protein
VCEELKTASANIPVQLLSLLGNRKFLSFLFYSTIHVSFCLNGIEPAAPEVDDRRLGGGVIYLSH